MDNKKFYITTAIAYASRKPHIGNTYDIVLADMIARYKRMEGYDVYFVTGSDEHGQKIEEYAKAEGITPKAFVDKAAGEIKRVWDSMDVTYDKFIRTTVQQTIITKRLFRKYLRSSTNRVIFIKVIMRVNIVFPVNRFSPLLNL